MGGSDISRVTCRSGSAKIVLWPVHPSLIFLEMTINSTWCTVAHTLWIFLLHGLVRLPQIPGISTFLFSSKLQYPNMGAHPASYSVGTGGSFPEGKTTKAWSWPLTPSSTEVKNEWSRTSTPPICFHGVRMSQLCLHLPHPRVRSFPVPTHIVTDWQIHTIHAIKPTKALMLNNILFTHNLS